jgi:hypothetical protein
MTTSIPCKPLFVADVQEKNYCLLDGGSSLKPDGGFLMKRLGAYVKLSPAERKSNTMVG